MFHVFTLVLVSSLQDLCLGVIRRTVENRHIHTLPLPKKMKRCLRKDFIHNDDDDHDDDDDDDDQGEEEEEEEEEELTLKKCSCCPRCSIN
jgi:hypothetical protein